MRLTPYTANGGPVGVGHPKTDVTTSATMPETGNEFDRAVKAEMQKNLKLTYSDHRAEEFKVGAADSRPAAAAAYQT